jgi:hypothetical protein
MRIAIRREPAMQTDCVRLRALVSSGEGDRDVWFEIPAELEPEICETGEPWLLLMLPLAARTGEAVELEMPVDPLFLENVRGLAETWAHWYPDLHVPTLCAPSRRAQPTGGRVAQFFSGGVDSWFTLLRHTESPGKFPQIGDVDELITVWGFDIPISDPDEFRPLHASVRETAERFGKRSIVIATNLRDQMQGAWKEVWGPRWGPLTHGTGLATVALLVGSRYSMVKVASTHRFWEPFPYGSHPMTDSLFSTSTTSFCHDHALYSRIDKIERIAESEYALSRLKVCYSGGQFRNCSECVKCHRMLLCFDTLGILDKAKSFDLDLYERNRGRPFVIRNANDRVRALEVRELAARKGRNDIAAVIDQSIRRSTYIRSTDALKRLSWRAWQAAYARATAGMLGA